MQTVVMYTFIFIGGVIGVYLPMLFGVDGFSIWSVIGSTVGGAVGIYAAYKLSHSM